MKTYFFAKPDTVCTYLGFTSACWALSCSIDLAKDSNGPIIWRNLMNALARKHLQKCFHPWTLWRLFKVKQNVCSSEIK